MFNFLVQVFSQRVCQLDNFIPCNQIEFYKIMTFGAALNAIICHFTVFLIIFIAIFSQWVCQPNNYMTCNQIESCKIMTFDNLRHNE